MAPHGGIVIIALALQPSVKRFFTARDSV